MKLILSQHLAHHLTNKLNTLSLKLLTVATISLLSLNTHAYYVDLEASYLDYKKEYDTASKSNDQDVSSQEIAATSYFKNISTEDVLFSEAAFMQQASFAGLSYKNTSYTPKGNVFKDSDNEYIEVFGRFVTESGFITGLTIENNDIADEIGSTPFESYDAIEENVLIHLGSYIGTRQEIVATIGRGEVQAIDLKAVDLDTFGVEYKSIWPLGSNGKYLKAIGGLTKYDFDDQEKTNAYNLYAIVGFYPTPKLGLDAEFGSYGEDRQITNDFNESRFLLSASYFVQDNFKLFVEIQNKSFRNGYWTSSSDDNGDIEGIKLGINFRL